jgi:isopropylmalate/homocitrate/citramalate synthase
VLRPVGFVAIPTATGLPDFESGEIVRTRIPVSSLPVYGVEIPGFKYHKLRELGRFMESMSGIPVQAHEPIIGANVFTHETGIHAAAMLIDRRMYEAVPALVVGLGSDRAGSAGVARRRDQLATQAGANRRRPASRPVLPTPPKR